jgi:hypothetical protein
LASYEGNRQKLDGRGACAQPSAILELKVLANLTVFYGCFFGISLRLTWLAVVPKYMN